MSEGIAYYTPIGESKFYFHAACVEEAGRRNVNNLTPEQLANSREQGFVEVSLAQVPDVGCSYQECRRSMHDKSKFE